ncbi:hypothetical protein CHUAL_005510 [Chamberlinius hualienensis]
MNFRLQTIDYVVLLGSFILSSLAGIYYGVAKKKNNSMEEYFLASRELSTFKLGCSIFATLVSSGVIVGLATEVYYYGFQSSLVGIIYIPAQYINLYLFFPVFYKIGSPDTYKYFELRFFKQMRYFLSFINIFEKIFSNSIVIYGTAVVLSSVLEINFWILATATTVVCTLYSSLGGVRGVTVADTIQSFVMIGAVVAVCIVGLQQVGGIGVVFQRNWESGRLNIFNFDVNPKIRHTFWSSTIGNLFVALSAVTTSQTVCLRMMASASMKQCRRAALCATIIIVSVLQMSSFIGLLIYTAYYACDPIASKAIRSPNQLISMFIGDELSGFTGLAGVFYAGFLCASVSTLSSTLNGVAALAMETFVKSFNLVQSEIAYITTAKIFVIIHGLLSLSGIAIVELFPNIYQAMITLMAVVNAPQFSIMIIGMFFPKANVKSSIASFFLGIIFMLWIVLGTIVAKVPSKTLPISIAGCELQNLTNISNNTLEYSSNSTFGIIMSNSSLFNAANVSASGVSNIRNTYFPLSAMAYSWFGAMGTIFTLMVFAVLSLLFGAEKQRAVNLDLIPEPVQRFQKRLSKKWQKWLLCDVYMSVNCEAQEMINIQSEQLIGNEENKSTEEKERICKRECN